MAWLIEAPFHWCDLFYISDARFIGAFVFCIYQAWWLMRVPVHLRFRWAWRRYNFNVKCETCSIKHMLYCSCAMINYIFFHLFCKWFIRWLNLTRHNCNWNILSFLPTIFSSEKFYIERNRVYIFHSYSICWFHFQRMIFGYLIWCDDKVLIKNYL